ncbi:helix-turn-helix domain containing protein [Paucibacter sediminis]|uniref:Helix-turn-helix domain containing protein n=1 Tax=Paucibacter sediminis TaxID=3019553 RepID=A0AA95NLL4_9BURK|nr:TetR/AcrR family transcriptional regulator [Paucibacter sp. S2-9]WIT13351.1 helix-turn-helix domain containing protein [Paucibacter sp. S2-9]
MPELVVKPPDRRAQRSRELLLEALFSLMCERGYERLTIQNLLDRAGVGRATFYAHFESKDELLGHSVQGLRGWLESARAPDRRLGFSLAFFQHLASHRQLYRMTVARESEVSVERHMRAMLRALVHAELAQGQPPGQGGAAVDLATQYVVGALWSMLVWWMDEAQDWSAERVNELFERMTFPGLDLTLGTRF